MTAGQPPVKEGLGVTQHEDGSMSELIAVSKHLVGKLIGKAGATIQQLQADTGTAIQIDQVRQPVIKHGLADVAWSDTQQTERALQQKWRQKLHANPQRCQPWVARARGHAMRQLGSRNAHTAASRMLFWLSAVGLGWGLCH